MILAVIVVVMFCCIVQLIHVWNWGLFFVQVVADGVVVGVVAVRFVIGGNIIEMIVRSFRCDVVDPAGGCRCLCGVR